jgi:hypothetical protein
MPNKPVSSAVKRTASSRHAEHEPPEVMTEAAFDYYRETTDIAAFIVFLLNTVDNLDRAGRIAAEALLPHEVSPHKRARLQAHLDGDFSHRKQLREFDPLLWQMLYARTVDNYLSYLSGLLSHVFATQPGTLMSKDMESVSYVLQFDTRDELISALAEKRVSRLAFMSLEELHKELLERKVFRLFSSVAEKKQISTVGLLRNLIVHNRGRINRRYRERLRDSHLVLGAPVQISGLQVLDTADMLSKNVRRLHRQVADKFHLATPRTGQDVIRAWKRTTTSTTESPTK